MNANLKLIMAISVILIISSIVALLAVKRGWIEDKTFQTTANIGGTLSFICGIIALLISATQSSLTISSGQNPSSSIPAVIAVNQSSTPSRTPIIEHPQNPSKPMDSLQTNQALSDSPKPSDSDRIPTITPTSAPTIKTPPNVNLGIAFQDADKPGHPEIPYLNVIVRFGNEEMRESTNNTGAAVFLHVPCGVLVEVIVIADGSHITDDQAFKDIIDCNAPYKIYEVSKGKVRRF